MANEARAVARAVAMAKDTRRQRVVQFECGWVAVIRLWKELSLMDVFDDVRNRTIRPSG
jgi:hypothetical protein